MPQGGRDEGDWRAIVDGERCVGMAQPVDRCGRIDASTLSRLLNDEIDGTLGERTARPPNGWEHGRRGQRIATAGKQAGSDKNRRLSIPADHEHL